MASSVEKAVLACKADIEEYGLDTVKKIICPMLYKMVAATRLRHKHGVQIIADGFDGIDTDRLEAAVQCIADAMPDGTERDEIRADLAFWRENRQEIMALHHVTPEPENTTAS